MTGERGGTVEAEVELRDGTPAVILHLTSLKPITRAAVDEVYARLSPESQFHRFLSAVPHLTDHQLHTLIDEVDDINHVALVLAVRPVTGPESVVGVARMIRLPGSRTDADVAVTVLDDWQGRGVASALIDALLEERPRGVTRVLTVVAADNDASLAMLHRMGEVHTEDRGTVIEVSIDLKPPSIHDPARTSESA